MTPAAADEAAPRPLTGGAVMGAASRATVAATGAATTILVARLLGDEGSGNFAVALTVVFVLTVLTTLGVEHGVAYYVSSGRWHAGDAFATTQRVALAMGTLGAAGGILARLAIPSAFGDLTVAETAVTAAVLPFSLAWFYGTYVALADDHYEAFVIPPAAQSALLLVGGVGLIVAFGLPGAIAALAASHVVVALGMLAWGRRRLRRSGGAPDEPGQLRRALAFGVKGYAANALQVLNYRVDFFLLSVVLFPRVAALSASTHRDAEEQRAFVEAKSLRHTTLLVVLATAVLALALLLLVVPVYGPDFEDSIALGLIRLPGVALLGIASVLSATIIGRGRPEYGLYTALITTPVTLALYALLIPAYEATGAALASSLSFALSFALSMAFYRRATGRGVLGLLLPGRSELEDYRLLAPKIREWAAGLRRRRA